MEDKLKRNKHFKPLTKLLNNVKNESFVMTVSSSYGTGKTFFVNQWKEYLEKGKCKTLYYNAWENDTANNPLMSFIANFKELGLSETTWIELLSAAGDVCVDELLSHSNIISDYISCATGNPFWRWITKIFCKSIQKAKKMSEDIFDKAECKSVFFKQIKIENDRKEQIIKLKKAIKNILPKVTKEETNFPTDKLIIFIDDLDRCSPSYAIKFLEYIKHIFDVENCIFVLAVDEEQLKSSVEVVYGNKNGEDFLAKIIDFRFKLPTPDISQLIDYFANILKWEAYFLVNQNWEISKEEKKQNFIDVFNALAKSFQLTARDIIHICQNLDIVFKSHEPEYISPLYILLVYVIENYKYKIEKDLNPLIQEHNGNELEGIRKYLRIHNFYLKNETKQQIWGTIDGCKAVIITSNLEDFISVLDGSNRVFPENQTEAFYALSIFDFEEGNYKDIYKKTKRIIQDIIEFDEQKNAELENNRNWIFNKRHGYP